VGTIIWRIESRIVMPKSSHCAGQNIRELARKRRVKAIAAFAAAGGVVVFPILLLRAIDNFLKQLPALSSVPQPIPDNALLGLYLLIAIAASGLVLQGVFLWKRANRADQGAQGEEAVAQEMTQLEREGWQVEYNLRLGGRLGDADIVCISPQNKAYVIDVKSHRGDIITDGQQLYRQMGKATYEFEKNFLEQALKQALQVKKQKNLNFVTPIVAFSNGRVAIASGKLQKVYVVEKSRLVWLLKSLG